MTDNNDVEAYRRSIALKTTVIIVLLISVILMAGYSCTLSTRDMTLVEGLEAIWNHIIGNDPEFGTSEYLDSFMIWEVTMPRVMAAIITGAGLAVCGALMQGVMNNPLADPYTVGVSSAASLGAILAIVLGINMIPGLEEIGIIANAFVVGLLPVALIMILGKVTTRLSPVVIILVGVALSYFLGGLSSLIMVYADPESLQDAFRWQIGSLDRMSWEEIPVVTLMVSLGIVFAMLTYNKLNAMSAGDTVATTLGMNVKQYRLVSLIIVTIVAATIISFTGIIGFVGLIAPHMIRILMGGNNRFLIPTAILAGAAILMFADIVSRLIASVDVPVGAVMSFIGAPVFLYLIVSKRGKGVY